MGTPASQKTNVPLTPRKGAGPDSGVIAGPTPFDRKAKLTRIAFLIPPRAPPQKDTAERVVIIRGLNGSLRQMRALSYHVRLLKNMATK